MPCPSAVARRLGSLVTAGTLLVVTGCSALAGAGPPEPVIVGVDLDLTGRSGGLDTVFEQALQLRVEQLNQQRERSGDRPVQLRMLDNASDRDASIANLAELATDPRVSGIITGGCGQCVIAAAEEINAAAVPVISLASEDAVAEPVAERRFIFRLGPDAAGSADVLATELSSREVNTIGLVTSDDQYGSDGARELGEATATLRIEVPIHEVVPDGGADDLAGLVDRIARWTPELDPFAPAPQEPAGLDAVVLWTPEQQALELAVALRGAGWDGSLWLDMAAAGDLFYVGEVAAALDGAWLLASDTLAMDDVVASVPDLAKRRDWFDSYLSRYGGYHARASFAADALDLIVEATDRIGTDPTRVRDTLEAIGLSGRTGPVGFAPANHSGFDPRSLAVLRFTEDRWHASAT